MNPLSGIAGMAVDRMLGLGPAAVRYVLRPGVAVEMPDGVVLLDPACVLLPVLPSP